MKVAKKCQGGKKIKGYECHFESSCIIIQFRLFPPAGGNNVGVWAKEVRFELKSRGKI